MTRFTGKTAALACALAASFTTGALAETPAEMFARPVEYGDATLSPTGEYVAVTTPFEDRRALSIIKLSGSCDRSLIKFDAKERPYNPVWTDDSRIIVEKVKDYGYVGSLARTGNIYAANADASKQVELFGYRPDQGNVRSRVKDEGTATFMKLLPGTKGEALFYYQPWSSTMHNSKSITSVFRVDTYTGTRNQIATFPDDVGVVADNAGVVRFVVAEDLNGKQIVQYRRLASDAELAPVPADLAGSQLFFWYFEPDNNHVYALISEHGEPAALYRVALAEGTRERVAGNSTMEVSRILPSGYMGNPFAVGYSAGRPKIDYTDAKSEWAQLYSALLKLFPGQMVSFQGITRDNNKLLFFVYSDRHPGAYYLFDRTTKTPQSMDWIDPAKMSPMTPIEFKNRSGDLLYGFFTAPLGKQGPHPLVVMPHGGPFGVSDSWGYDADVQFLASLGYAVLQVNYRGSGDRGLAFEEATYKQWGTGIQDDIADGVKHLIAQKLVDPNKICIYGISFGGYSAMMNPIRNPGMYKCAIGYSGVYDLKKSYADDDGSIQGRSFFGRTMGADAEVFAAQSPTTLVAALDAPILLIHGTADYVAPFAQFTAAEAALRHAGKTYETLVKQNEGHGFYKIANRVEVYNKIQAFLLKYNPPN
jgi:dipeptidyl aminopeptidase/acylaminoacyl peptidase